MKNRDKIVEKVISRDKIEVKTYNHKSQLFESNVFNSLAMQEFLTKDAYEAIKNTKYGIKLDRELANEIANGMKLWALSKNVSHYTHWFQPLNGNTAEKHDSFFETQFNGRPIEYFSGTQLVQQESDASSFPNGGLRNTFEARGYSAWDPTSPAFIFNNTLCIPTIFISYNGDALDNKTPLLKSINAIDKHATEVAHYFDENVKGISTTLGWEQEYFLVDKLIVNKRKDLDITGRTLFGVPLVKGQQMSDHYFGSIPSRVLDFMQDLENDCIKLGIPVKTRHNEVAPNQFELAPIYEEMNLAVDHNSLLMDVMKKVAEKHNFKVLFHEKPFKGINGSGKHNNWSLATNKGVNLLTPGKTPEDNLQFLTFFINTIKAVHDNEELLRASIASLGNEFRLGANEAPPAIMSVFVGEELTNILNELISIKNDKLITKKDHRLNILSKIPDIFQDNTDRNRTSPFAFTGNKWEFRAVGSTANCAGPMTILNTIVAKQLKHFKIEVDKLIAENINKDEAILFVLKEYVNESKKILFEGNGYSKEWEVEAVKLGLSNNKSTPDALKAKVSKQTIDLFEEMEVLNTNELNARYIIELEEYVKKLKIECLVLSEIIEVKIIPCSIKYMNILLKNVKKLEIECLDMTYQTSTIKEINKNINLLHLNIEAMKTKMNELDKLESIVEKSKKYSIEIDPYLEILRKSCDILESIVDDNIWTMLKYEEILVI